MFSVKTTFSAFDDDQLIFLTPPGFQINFQSQYIASSSFNDKAFLVCNESGQTYELKTLQSTNQLFLTSDIPNKNFNGQNINFFAGCCKYIELVKTQPNILETVNQVIKQFQLSKNKDNPIGLSPVPITCSVQQFVDFAANYLLVSGQICYYDFTVQAEVALMLSRQFVNKQTEYDKMGKLCLSDPTFSIFELQKQIDVLEINLCKFPMLFYYANFQIPCFDEENVQLQEMKPTYSDLLARMIYGGNISGLEKIPINLPESQNADISPLINKHLQIQLDCIKIVSEILYKLFQSDKRQVIKSIIDYLNKLDITHEFYIELVYQLYYKFDKQIQQFQNRNLILISQDGILLLPELICLLCSAKITGKYRYRISTCLVDFTRKLTENTQILFIDEFSLALEAKRAQQLDKISKIWTDDQLQRLYGSDYHQYFREQEVQSNSESYYLESLKFYSFKRELDFMAM